MLCTVSSACAEDAEKPVYTSTQQNIDVMLLSPERLVTLPLDKIVETLKIKPGMQIADIGAGLGAFSFPIADALKGTGMVYATDAHMPNIRYLEDTIREKGYQNVTPIFIKDPQDVTFYGKHSFDIIFLCEVLPFMWHFENYLRRLRPSLAPETGRLFIVQWKWASPLEVFDINDYRLFLSVFLNEGRDFPIFLRLSKKTQDMISEWDRSAVPELLRKQLVEELNGMLLDTKIFNDLADHYYKKIGSPVLSSASEALIGRLGTEYGLPLRILVTDLDDAGILDKEARAFSAEEKEKVQRLNKFLLYALFKADSFSYRQDMLQPHIFIRSKKSVIRKVEAAGFQLVGDYDILSKYYFLEFKKKD